MLKFAAAAAAGLLALSPLAAASAMDSAAAPMGHARASILQTAMASPDHGTLVAAVKAAGLVETLSGAGPFTVFAPTDAAFARLPAGTVETLIRPENRAMLQGILTYHVVPGKVTAAQLMKTIKANGGAARLTTVAGGRLTARLVKGKVVVTDEQGGRATVAKADLVQSNGVIHVTDAVFMPR